MTGQKLSAKYAIRNWHNWHEWKWGNRLFESHDRNPLWHSCMVTAKQQKHCPKPCLWFPVLSGHLNPKCIFYRLLHHEQDEEFALRMEDALTNLHIKEKQCSRWVYGLARNLIITYLVGGSN